MKKFIDHTVRVLEEVIPGIMLMILFATFVIGIFCRYVLNNPQAWTYELSTITYLAFVVLSWPLVQRENEHISFNMFYERKTPEKQRIMRLVSNAIVSIAAIVMVVVSIQSLMGMSGLVTQVMKIPRWLVFVSFPISFALCALYSLLSFVKDLKIKEEN